MNDDLEPIRSVGVRPQPHAVRSRHTRPDFPYFKRRNHLNSLHITDMFKVEEKL